MGCASLILGLFGLAGVMLALVPFLNVLNCIALPAAGLGLLLALVDLVRVKEPGEGRGAATVGLVINLLALMIGMARFFTSLFTTGGIL
jgi:hypothetical protein